MNWIAKTFDKLFHLVRDPLTRDRFSGPDEEQWVKVSDTPEGRLWAVIATGECPDCHHLDGFYEGPSGGLSTNIICANCGHRFNVTPMLGIAERLDQPGDDDKKGMEAENESDF